MKSKKTIGLLILVIGIWGAIAYQVYQQMVKEEPLIQIPVRKAVLPAGDSSNRYELVLNYPDPFLKTVSSSQTTSAATPRIREAKPAVVITKPTEVPVSAWDKFLYLGSVYNATRQSYLAMIKINGVEYMPRVGEIVDDFKILDIRKDSVQVEYATQKRYFKKN